MPWSRTAIMWEICFYLYVEMLGKPVSPGACVLALELIGDW